MTTPTTGYLVNINAGTSATPSYQDLSLIFKGLTGTTKAATTGFTNSAGKDLNTIFNPLSSTTTIGYNTNMISLTGKDLRYVFDPFTTTPTTLSYTVGSTPIYESSVFPYTGVLFYIPFGSTAVANGQLKNSITFNQAVNANVIIVGGGAGGGTYLSTTPYTYNWIGCGGGGGGITTFPFTFAGNTKYNLAIGQGGLGGTTQTSGNSSYLQNGTTYYVAIGGLVSAPDATTGNQTSCGGSTSLLPSGSSVPSGWTGCGGGGGGGEAALLSGQTFNGGTGGSNYDGLNPGVQGGRSTVSSGNYYGGAGGASKLISVSTPFNSPYSMKVGGGGGAGTNIYSTGVSSLFYGGAAGLGSGGGTVNTSASYNMTAYVCNANNNSYSKYTVSSSSSSSPGPTGIGGGYGAGGGATYYSTSNSRAPTGGFGGNGCVIIYWDNTLYPS